MCACVIYSIGIFLYMELGCLLIIVFALEYDTSIEQYSDEHGNWATSDDSAIRYELE